MKKLQKLRRKRRMTMRWHLQRSILAAKNNVTRVMKRKVAGVARKATKRRKATRKTNSKQKRRQQARSEKASECRQQKSLSNRRREEKRAQWNTKRKNQRRTR